MQRHLEPVKLRLPILQLLLAAIVSIASADAATPADVLLIARPGPAGPAGWLAGQQIANWPTQAPLKIVDHEPEKIPPRTALAIELTEDFDFRAEMPTANGATIHVQASPDSINSTQQLAHKVADALNATIDAPSERFIVETTIAPAETVPRVTIITSTKDEMNRQRLSKRTRQHRVAVHAALLAEQVVHSELTPQRIAADRKPGVLRVAFFDDVGARNRTVGANPVWVRESMRGENDFDVSLISAGDIQAGALNGQFDVLVVGGGSSKTEAATLGAEGRKAIQSFVDQGGGYVGICAGAFLAAQNSGRLGISPVRTKSTNAGGQIDIQVTEFAQQLSNLPAAKLKATFHGGPVLIPSDEAAQKNLKVWATFNPPTQSE